LLTLKKLLSLDSYEDLELLIQNKCSSNVISSWLKGDFKLSRPVSSQMDVVAMSALYDINHDYLLTRVLSRSRMSIGKIRAAMLFLELKLHTDVETMMQHPADVENGYVILSG
jgi:aconitase B